MHAASQKAIGIEAGLTARESMSRDSRTRSTKPEYDQLPRPGFAEKGHSFHMRGEIVQAEDSDSITQTGDAAALPAIGELRVTALDDAATPQRRFGPRRRIISVVRDERRRADRRGAKPGLDGLLRMVLADAWQDSPRMFGLRMIE
jgi:hypothetical protein